MELFRLLGTIVINNDDAIAALKNTTDNAESSETRMSKAFKKIGAAVAGAFTIKQISDFGKACVNAAVAISAETASFGQIMGDYSDKAQAKIDEIAETTGIVSGRLTGYMTSMTAKFQGLGYDIDDATTLAQDGLMIAADAAAFWDKSMEDSMSSLNSFVNGNYEGGEAIGLFANETTLASWAAENLGLEWTALTEKEKQFARLEFAKAMQKTSGVTGQAANESEAYANVMGNLQRIWQEFQITIGEPILNNLVLPAMVKLQNVLPVISGHVQSLVDWFNKHEKGVKLVTSALKLALTAMLAFKAGAKIQGIINAFQQAKVSLALYTATMKGATVAQGVMNGTLTATETIVALLTGRLTLAELATALYAKAQAGLNAVMAANPVGIVVMAIAALVAAFVLLWNKCEGFREFWINLWENIKEKTAEAKEKIVTAFNNLKENVSRIFNSIKSVATKVFGAIRLAMTNPIEAARLVIKALIDKIKSYFNFKWSLPKLKMPHISIKGKFKLDPPSTPKFSIKWYKKAMDNAMLLNSPTIFGYGDGSFLGGGEAGQEVVAGSETLMNMVKSAVASQNIELVSTLQGILSAIKQMDAGMYQNIERALDNRKIQWNDRELGRLVNKYA